MPYVTQIIPQHEITITRPVITQFVEDIMKAYGVPSDMRIVYEEELGSLPLREALLAKKKTAKDNDRDKDKDIQIEVPRNHDFVKVTYREKYAEDAVLRSVAYNREHVCVFNDQSLGLRLSATYASVIVEMNITFNFRSRVTLSALRRRLRMAHGLSAIQVRHSIRYNYGLPKAMTEFLYDAWVMREAVEPYGDTLSEYLDNHFYKGRMSRANVSSTYARVAIDEIQSNIRGEVASEFFYNEPEVNEGVYELGMEYKTQYEQPIGLVLRYPNMIHNQHIPERYQEIWEPPPVVTTFIDTMRSYPRIENDYAIPPMLELPGDTRLDPTDEWFPERASEGYGTVVIVPLEVELGNRRSVFNLSDLPENYLPLHIRNYIQDHPLDSIVPHRSAYLVQAHRLGDNEDLSVVEISPTGDITTTIDMDPRKRNYLRISMLMDLGNLSQDHFDYLAANPYMAEATLDARCPGIRLNTNGLLRTIGVSPGWKVAKPSLRDTIGRMPSTGAIYKEAITHGTRTVMNTALVALRK